MGNIVWVASYPKSGNTWMRFFLYAYFSLEVREIDEVDINSEKFVRMFPQDLERHLFEPHLDKPWEKVTKKEIAALRTKAQTKIAAQRSGMIFVKTHNALIGEFGYPTINADVTAGAIYMVRNPLDLIASVMSHYGIPSADKAMRFINNQGQIINSSDKLAHGVICSWRRNVESWAGLPREGIHTIRYEDMLQKPVETFSGVIRFLGQKLDPGRLRRALELTSFDRLQSKEQAAGFIEKSNKSEMFFRSGTAGSWRKSLSDQQVSRLVEVNGKIMEKFGYLPS